MGKKNKKKQLQQMQQEQPAAKPVYTPKFMVPEGRIVWWKIAILALIVFAAAFAVYANTLTADFIWDDEYLIINNTQVKSFANFKNIFKTYVGYGSENINNFYRPMQELSNMIDFALWGLEPFGFHLTNTIFHSLVSLMVLLLLYNISRNMLASFIAAMFYAVHPVHTEAVAYIAGRADPLYSFFMLLSLVLFVKSVNRSSKTMHLYIMSIFFFVVSLLSKEMVFILPLILFLYMLYFLRGTQKNDLFTKYKWRWVPYAAIVGFYGYLRATVLSFSDIAPASAFQKIPFIFRLLTFFKTIALYIRLMFFPIGLHMERTLRITKSLMDAEALLALLIVAAIIFAAYFTYHKKKRLISFWIVWFFAILLPVSNIIPINSFLAEHWIYMASIGPFMLFGMGMSWVWKKMPARARSLHVAYAGILIVPFLLYARGTVTRNTDWHDEISFFNSTLKYHPKNARLYLNLGNTYYENKQIDQAIEQYKKAIEINKKYAVAYGNIGSALLNKRKQKEAEEYLKKAISFKYNYPIAHYNMGIIYFNKKQYDKALQELQVAVKQLPQLYQAHNMLGRTYLKIGKVEEAKQAFRTSLSIYANQPQIQGTLNRLEKLKGKLPPKPSVTAPQRLSTR